MMAAGVLHASRQIAAGLGFIGIRDPSNSEHFREAQRPPLRLHLEVRRAEEGIRLEAPEALDAEN